MYAREIERKIEREIEIEIEIEIERGVGAVYARSSARANECPWPATGTHAPVSHTGLCVSMARDRHTRACVTHGPVCPWPATGTHAAVSDTDLCVSMARDTHTRACVTHGPVCVHGPRQAHTRLCHTRASVCPWPATGTHAAVSHTDLCVSMARACARAAQPSGFEVSGIGSGICHIFPSFAAAAGPNERLVDVEALAALCPRGALPGQGVHGEVRACGVTLLLN